MRLNVRVTPNAKKDEILGFVEGVMKLKVRAPAVEGTANRAVVKFISKKTGVPSSMINLISGERSRIKVIEIEGEEKMIMSRLKGEKWTR